MLYEENFKIYTGDLIIPIGHQMQKSNRKILKINFSLPNDNSCILCSDDIKALQLSLWFKSINMVVEENIVNEY